MTGPGPLVLQSERYNPTGNLASEGVRNQLGRPKLDQLTVLMRESMQNSWDAKSPGRSYLDYDLQLRHATPDQRDFLKHVIFVNCPANLNIRTALNDSRPLPLLTLSDRGTTGLGGETRADVVVGTDAPPQDFVDFLRNIGQPPDKSLGGGTFGYGKAALYQVSRCRTILVYTRCRYNGAFQTRFMVAALGYGFTIRASGPAHGHYTGRHWWGRQEKDLVEPLLNEQADAVAQGIGMPGFTGATLGTSIMILDFDPGQERTDKQAMDVMLESVRWNLWPKLVPLAGGLPPIRFTASLHGAPCLQPDLSEHYPLQGYAEALKAIRLKNSGGKPQGKVQLLEIMNRKTRQHFGWLALTYIMRTGKIRDRKRKSATGRPESDRNHHIALMRSAELVVRYLTGPLLQNDMLEYVGVFVASNAVEVDRAFAASEPPTHDDWVVETLSDKIQRSCVRVSLNRLKELVEDFVSPVTESAVAGDQVPLGAISAFMGEILTGLPGPGGDRPPARKTERAKPTVKNRPDPPETPEDPPQPPTGAPPGASTGPTPSAGPSTDPSASPAAPRPIRIGQPSVRASSARLDVVGDVPVLMMDVTVKHGKNSTGTRLLVTARALVDGGGEEKEAPAGAAVPEVNHWCGPDGVLQPATGSTLEVPLSEAGTWQVGVRLIDDAEVRVSIRGEALE